MFFELMFIIMLRTGDEREFVEKPHYSTMELCNKAAVAFVETIRPNPAIGIYRVECRMVEGA